MATTTVDSHNQAPALNTVPALTAEVKRLRDEISFLRAQLQLKQSQAFSASSEATRVALMQEGSLFNEAEALSEPALPEPTVEQVTVRRKRKGRRAVQVADLPVETVRHELPANERTCSCCSGPLHEIGVETSQKLKIVPARALLEVHERMKYGCRHCANHDTSAKVRLAPMPRPAFPNGLGSPSAVAFLMSQKFELGLPFYRQEQYLQGLGIDLSRQTMANWIIAGARWLQPVYRLLQAHMKREDVLHADETRVQVLREPGREASEQSFMWVYCCGRHGPPITLYDYEVSRGGEHPRKFLEGFTGFLHADGYAGYNQLPAVKVAGCWAHARRKFVEVLRSLPPGSGEGPRCAGQVGLDYCNRLYKIERELSELTPQKRLLMRQQRCVPLLKEFDAWLNAQVPVVLPRSALGKAIAYLRNQWAKLQTFLEDGRLEIDNNRCERAVKSFVIGRKNWLFANTPHGARASALAYSIVETARGNGLRPAAYLEYLFERLPNIQGDDAAALESLLPWAPAVQVACK